MLEWFLFYIIIGWALSVGSTFRNLNETIGNDGGFFYRVFMLVMYLFMSIVAGLVMPILVMAILLATLLNLIGG